MNNESTLRQKAKALRNNMTDAEKRLWIELRRRRLFGCKFRRQQPLGSYIVDFVCLSERLIIELDGGHHARELAYDRHRDHWLTEQGFTVLRFWNNDVFEKIEGVLQTIAHDLTRSLEKSGCVMPPDLPPPNLPRKRGRSRKLPP